METDDTGCVRYNTPSTMSEPYLRSSNSTAVCYVPGDNSPTQFLAFDYNNRYKNETKASPLPTIDPCREYRVSLGTSPRLVRDGVFRHFSGAWYIYPKAFHANVRITTDTTTDMAEGHTAYR